MKSTSRNAGVAGKGKTQRALGCAGNTNARSDQDFGRDEDVPADLKSRCRVGQISAVVQGSRNAEGLAEATRTGGQGRRLCTGLEPAVGCHGGQAFQWFESADQDAAGLALRLAGDIEAGMKAVDEIDVRMAGRPEEDLGARCAAGGGMGGRVIDTEISLGLDYATGESLAVDSVDEKLAKEPWRDLIRRPEIGSSVYDTAGNHSHRAAGCGGMDR